MSPLVAQGEKVDHKEHKNQNNRFLKSYLTRPCLPWWPASAGGMHLIPGSRKSTGEGNGNPLQYSCLGSPLDRAAW